MDVVEAIKLRKSVRGYKPDPVSREILSEILEIATRSPSSVNIQPWEFTIVAGEVLDKIRQANVRMLESGASTNPDIGVLGPFTGVYRQRQVELAIQIFKLMDISREDKAKRREWYKRGNQFFNAPAAIIISTDKSLGEVQPMFDVGAVTQTIALAALNYGLGTCIQDQVVMFPEIIRAFTGIPESKQIVISIAIGYPDWEFPANRLQSKREPYENVTTWCGI